MSAESMLASSPRLRAIGLAVLLAAMTFAAYLPALQGSFIWDDDNYVTTNVLVQSADGLARIWSEPSALPQYYPLTFTSFWVEHRLWGLEPFGYHLVNVLLQALNALLVWRLLRRLDLPGAWLAAAIFAVHPIGVESVAWITERKNVLSGACYLGAALAYLRFSPPSASPRGSVFTDPRPPAPGPRWGWYVLALVLFCGALLSKTVTCSLPAALALVLWWKRERLERRDWMELAPFFALGLVAAGVTVWIEREHVGAQGAEWAFSAIERVLIAGRILWFYAWTLVWPTNLAFIYPRWQIDAAASWQWLFPITAVAVVGLLFLARARLGKGPLVAALFYAGTLVPALGFFNVYPMRYSFVADHFAYLASLGLIALAAAAATIVLERRGVAANTRQSLAAILLVVLAVLSRDQSRVYANPETLWTDTVAKNPTGWAGLVNLGGVLADQGRLDEAIALMQRSVGLWPDSPESHNALGAMWDQQGDLDLAAAELGEAIRLEPRYYEAHTNLGMVLASQGKLDESLAHLTAATRLKPGYAEAYYHLATTLAALGRSSEAARNFATALLLAPGNPDAENGLCALQLEQGRIDDALLHCGEAVAIDPNLPAAQENMARALARKGLVAEARQREELARRLRRELAAAHRHTAGELVAQRKPRAAIAHLREALRLDPDDAAARESLEQVLASQH